MDIKRDAALPFPRVCSHRGFNTAAPENTIPAFAMAVALGAQELEFDLWPSRDGDLFVCHDPKVDRTTDGKGMITELTTKELKALDAGGYFSPRFQGIRLPLLTEVLDQFGGKAVFNIHIKSPVTAKVPSEGMRARQLAWRENYAGNAPIWPMAQKEGDVLPEIEYRDVTPYDEGCFQKILDALDSFHCRESVYITGEKDVLLTARAMAPDIPRCCLEGHMNFSIVENALAFGCKKLQFCKGLTTQAMIDKAKAAGLTCNLFWSDDPVEARHYLDAGIDCLLVNDLLAVLGKVV